MVIIVHAYFNFIELHHHSDNFLIFCGKLNYNDSKVRIKK